MILNGTLLRLQIGFVALTTILAFSTPRLAEAGAKKPPLPTPTTSASFVLTGDGAMEMASGLTSSEIFSYPKI